MIFAEEKKRKYTITHKQKHLNYNTSISWSLTAVIDVIPVTRDRNVTKRGFYFPVVLHLYIIIQLIKFKIVKFKKGDM